MRRRLLLSVVLVMLLSVSAFLVPGAASARSISRARPDARALSAIQWPSPNGVYGAQTSMWMDNPGLGTNDDWFRAIELQSGSTDAYFGIEKCGIRTACTFCFNNAGGILYLFITYSGATTFCTAVPADAKNTPVSFLLYNSNGDLEAQTKDGPSDMPCAGICSDANKGSKTWGSIILDEFIDSTFTGHRVYGGNWTNNQYLNTKTPPAWVYQTNPGGVLNGPGNPPQMGWDYCVPFNGFQWCFAPSTNNPGGSLASCDYIPDAKCAYRS